MTSAQRRKLQRARRAHGSKGTTSCPRSTAPRVMVEGYSKIEPNNLTVARYCSVDHVADPTIGHGT